MRFVIEVEFDHDRVSRVYGRAASEVLECALLDAVRHADGVERARLVLSHIHETVGEAAS